MEHINFSIHDFVIISIVYTIVNREEDDYTVDDFTFNGTCLKSEIKETEMKFFSLACKRAREEKYDFEYDVILAIRNITEL